MEGLQVASTFTISQDPPEGGDYIVYRKSDRFDVGISPYDRVTVFAFTKPPFGFDEDPLYGSKTGWTLQEVEMIDVFMDDRENLPVFTLVEVRGAFCRVQQVGGDRVVRGLNGVWVSVKSIEKAIERNVLELLS